MKKNSLEIWLYGVILLAGMFLRFFRLGALPLMESEASAALQAYLLAQGDAVAMGAQSGYVLLTSALFDFLRSSEFWAHFLPALAGSCLILAPLLFRRWLGGLPAVLLAAFLALDPGLVILSRMADGSIFGITFFLFCAGFLLNDRPVLAGVFAALSLLGGMTLWFGLTVAAIGGAVFITYQKKSADGVASPNPGWTRTGRGWWGRLLAAFAITAALVFSLFLRFAPGLGGIFSGLTAYAEGWSYLVGGADMGGWIQMQSLSVKTSLISLLAYESLPLMLGVVSLIMALQRRDGLILALAAGAFIALMLIILYPGRGFAVFPWLTIPLWTMLCKYVLADYSLEDVELLPFLGLFALVMILAIFSAVNLKGVMTGNPADVAGTQLRYASILGSLLIILLGSGLVIWGWSVSTATKSLFAAVFVLLFFVNFQTLWYVVTAADHQRQEVWLSNRFADADLTARTVADYQRWNMGAGNQPGVWIAGVDSRALEWTLRNVEKLERTQALPASLDPEMIITSSSQQVALQDEYAGQDFVLLQQPVWDGLNAWSWMRWFFLRQTPHIDQSIILWVRMDQFPGYDANDLQPTN